MKHFLLTALLASFASCLSAQYCDPLYARNSERADSLYRAGDFAAAADACEEAIRHCMYCNNPADYYKAAAAYARAGKKEMAITHLTNAASMGYARLEQMMQDPDLRTLESDKMWPEILAMVSGNSTMQDSLFDTRLADELRKILEMDQAVRTDDGDENGLDPEAPKRSMERMMTVDSLNRIRIVEILDSRGWPGPDEVGRDGSMAVFLVLQHADQKTQEKYLPMMRQAVRNGKAGMSELAMLEDRVLIGQGKKQIYGSQIGVNDADGSLYLVPVEDPDHLEERRACAGMIPMAEYMAYFGLTWDLEAYKASLPALEEIEKARY